MKVYDSKVFPLVCPSPPVRFVCVKDELTLQLLYGFMMDLKKAVWLQTSRRSEQPLSQFVTLDKSKTDKQTKNVKSLVFLLASTGRNLDPRPQPLHPSPS